MKMGVECEHPGERQTGKDSEMLQPQARDGGGERVPPNVRRKKAELVFPKAYHTVPVPPKRIIPLSSIDRLLTIPVFTVFIYSHGGDEAYGRLKDGLGKLMCTWDVLAGSLQPNPDTGKLEVACCNQGAPMVEASVAMAVTDFAHFGDKPVYDLYRHFLPMHLLSPPGAPVSRVPLFLAQVTRFSCGGFALGMANSHCIADGISAYLLLNTWSAICRGVPASQLPVPLMDGSILYDKRKHPDLGIRHVAHTDVHEGEYSDLVRTVWADTETSTSTSESESGSGSRSGSESDLESELHHHPDRDDEEPELSALQHSGSAILASEIVYFKVTLPGKVINSLKEEVRNSDQLDRFSTFDVLAAHIWRSRARAVGFADPSAVLSLRFTVDFRPLVVPPLPSTYIGNGLWTATARCSADDLTRNLSLPQIVSLVQQAKSSVDDAFVRHMLESLEGAMDLSQLVSDPQSTTVITDWRGLPFEDVDFGWGVPHFFTPVRPPGQVETPVQIARGSRSDSRQGSVVLGLGLTPDQLPRFQRHLIDEVLVN